MNLKEQNTALIIIDAQKGFDDEEHWGGNRNNKDAETKIVKILDRWRELKSPIFHALHSSLEPDSKLHESHPRFEMIDEIKPIDGEPIIVKNVIELPI